MSNLLKEAIADAKAVRETALENAKAALEEAFTPRLQSMLSAKLKEEEAEEIETEEGEDEEAEEMAMDELEDEEEDHEPGHEGGGEEEKPLDVDAGDSIEEPSEDDSDDSDDSDDLGDDDDDDDDLDVEAIVKELEAEEDEEAEEGYDVDETEAEEDEDAVEETIEVNGQTYALVKEEEAEEEMDEEVDKSSGIGNGDNKKGDADVSSGIGTVKEEAGDDEETVEEIVDLSELLDELEDKDEDEDVAEEVEKLQGDLTEHRKVIKYLKSKLNEVNLLNAKLLFTNKLFKTYNLNNDQKLRVVETFDRAKNSREIKLIYSTLAESFSGKTSGVKVSKINEGFASKPVKSTKPSKKVINEGSDIAERFKKLAGIN